MGIEKTQEEIVLENKPELLNEYKFIYKDTEYDCTEYAKSNKHPGGLNFLNLFIDEKQDLTEYFRTLHSKQALKILKSFPKTGVKQEETESSKRFSILKKKLKHLFEPNWPIEIGLFLTTFTLFVTGCLTQKWYFSIPLLVLMQIISGWIGHSMNHNRNPILRKFALVYAPLCGGFSNKWWGRKHNQHHMFTNNILKDEDIQHDYKLWQFPFLFLKWKLDSILASYYEFEGIFLALHWVLLFNQNFYIVILSELIAGFFSASILVGNHENEMKFERRITLPFFEHQIAASRNYAFHDIFSLLIMGGMQYQTEHHFFPQIPFYRLPKARVIIAEELKKWNLKIHEGPIFEKSHL
ncbi:hypothetical protein ABPG72_003563 [Tetrahymena utriculariae]